MCKNPIKAIIDSRPVEIYQCEICGFTKNKILKHVEYTYKNETWSHYIHSGGRIITSSFKPDPENWLLGSDVKTSDLVTIEERWFV